MIDGLRVRYRSMFTIRVGPQRITFMIGAGPQLQFIKAKDEILDQAPVYKFTIPVFGEGIVYDSPLDERQQQCEAVAILAKAGAVLDIKRKGDGATAAHLCAQAGCVSCLELLLARAPQLVDATDKFQQAGVYASANLA